MKKELVKIVQVISFITFLLFVTYNIIFGDTAVTFNGDLLLLLLFLLTNPVLNLFRPIKKVIFNPLYNIYAIIVYLIQDFFIVNSLLIFINGKYDNAILYYYNNITVNAILLVILLILSFCFKKEKFKSKDKTNLILGTLFIRCIFILFVRGLFSSVTMSIIGSLATLLQLLIIVFIFEKRNNINKYDEIVNLYGVILLTNIITFNILGIILTIYLYLNIDKFGTFL